MGFHAESEALMRMKLLHLVEGIILLLTVMGGKNTMKPSIGGHSKRLRREVYSVYFIC